MTFNTTKVTSATVLRRVNNSMVSGHYCKVNARLYNRSATRYYPLYMIVWVEDWEADEFDDDVSRPVKSRALSMARQIVRDTSYYWDFDNPQKALDECNETIEHYNS